MFLRIWRCNTLLESVECWFLFDKVGKPKLKYFSSWKFKKLYKFVSSTIFKRKSNVKQILVELSKLCPWLCLSLFEFWAYFVVFLFSVQLKKITFLVWESQSVLSIFQASFQARVGKADHELTQLARSALPTLAWKLACKMLIQ